jgi:hypothetical protein
MTASVRRGAALEALRRAAVPGWAAAPEGWRTGVAALDVVWPEGVPRGRLVEWAGARSSGKAAVLASLVAEVLRSGEGVVWVDVSGHLDPGSWVWASGWGSPFWVVRVSSSRECERALDVVLRMGVWGLVVSEGAPSPVAAVRLARWARASGVAWVALVSRPGVVPGAAVRVRFERVEAGWPVGRVRASVSRRGWTRCAEFACEVLLPDRLRADPGLPDRRARGGRR